jgi:predicted PurR-regulated permease PerM
VGVTPLLVAQVGGLNVDVQRFIHGVNNLLGQRIYIAGQVFNLDKMFQQAAGALQGVLSPVFGQTLGLAIEVITSLVWVVFIFVVSFYLIKDAAMLHDWMENLVPPQYQTDYIRLRTEIGFIWASFFRGQLTLALVVAILFTVIGLILGLPFSLAMGVFAGLLEFLPSVGHGIWLIIASLLAFFVGSTWMPVPNWVFMLIVIGLHLVYQQFDLNYLIPRIIGRSVHLPPLVVILGIVTGAVLAGVIGILLAAPTIASARVIGRYVYANLFDLDPFPTSVVSPLPPPNPRWWLKIYPGKRL